MKIMVKEIDKFVSITLPKKVHYEYMIYLMRDNLVVEGYIELGEVAMKHRVNELVYLHKLENNNKEELIEEVSFNKNK